jgi:CheY-like chemotaxis protein
LDTAVLNLAINARDAMPDGGSLTFSTSEIEVDRSLAARLQIAPGPYVRLTVLDDGTGMTAETSARAFEPFFTTKDVGKGTGLGLSMVYGLFRQSGGSAAVRSAEGRGTAVDLYLPVARGETLRPRREIGGLAPCGMETILVVEDDDEVRSLVRGMLDGLGYRVLAAEHGARAVEMLNAADPIDLLLTDVMMPGGMSGRELARRALTLRPDLAVLFTSGHSSENADGHGAAGAANLLRKPYQRLELALRVREALGAQRSSAAA